MSDDAEILAKMLERGYVTPRHVAKKLRKNVSTVYRMIDANKVTAIKVGDDTFIDIDSVRAFIGAVGSDILGLNDWSDL